MVPLLYRDALMLVVDKPAGLPVHPDGRGGPTLLDELDALRFGLPRRPELAHRLDRATSGCLVLGRHARALARLQSLFATGAVRKLYWAIVEGGPEGESGRIDLPLSRASLDPRDWRMKVDGRGKAAETTWHVLARGADATWLALEPITGRTHQLRIHLAASGWPIRGDRLYGTATTGSRRPDGAQGLALHARSMAVPLYPKKPAIEVHAPPPPAFADALDRAGLPADLAVDPAPRPD